MNRAASILLACLVLANCAPVGGGGRSGGGDPRVQAACRQAADRVYDAQHRGDIFAPMSGVNSPQSGNYTSSADGPRLSQIYDRDNDIQDCVRRAGVSAAPATPAPPPPGR